MDPLDQVQLTRLMKLTRGRREVAIGLIDGPIALGHPDLTNENIRSVSGKDPGSCVRANSAACMHGTFVAGILCATRDSPAPAICPNCTLFARPIFAEMTSGNRQMPSATAEELASAIHETIDKGVRIINMSVALARPSTKRERELEEALNRAARQSIMIIVAAGNQGAIGSSSITRHNWVIPVVAYDLGGRPMGLSNLGSSIGKRGLGAPGENISSLSSSGKTLTLSGTSAATPFVTGTIALLWSEFPKASAAELRFALGLSAHGRKSTIVPPLLNAWNAYTVLRRNNSTG